MNFEKVQRASALGNSVIEGEQIFQVLEIFLVFQ